ncbi:hypothetical protein CPB84DRAFT_1758439 [Gymnopilus junonius]|uniref:Uncharacterized protein n=1 Tax=Gymnopilus junonius TaxID=109634 RepID=A0A9P5NZ04_GYMJU|nr:hypothetical protein CPB84DRAFT_1758439 [Gymnopilus junonius]
MSTQPTEAQPRAHNSVPPKAATTAVQMRSEKNTMPKVPPPILTPANHKTQQKKVSRRSSKPIINWFQRKLAGSGKAKRTENVPLRAAELGVARSSNSSRRITSSPLPVPSSHHSKQQSRPDGSSLARRKTRSISLHDDEVRGDLNIYAEDEISLDQSSLNRDSIWSPTSALEADDDASVRPLPPSSPPSPSPSRSSSSYLSDPRTFRSMAASTKPTTLLSIDLNGNGMAHIAQAPTPPPTQLNRFAPHVRQSSSLSSAGLLNSGGSITFSALPATQPSSRPNSLRTPGSLGSISLSTQQTTMPMHSVQAPLHTNHHPRNNPRPSSPPLDNASVLTLASSAFAMPNRPGALNYASSAIGDSVSHYGGSITFPDGESASHYTPGEDEREDERLEERDFDASVRALRPRSSRRGSWESEASRWSARVQGTPSLTMDRSLWASNSIRTGKLSAENGETYETADDQTQEQTPCDTEEFDKLESPLEPPLDGLHATAELSSTVKDIGVGCQHLEEDLTSAHAGENYPPPITLSRASTDTVAQPESSSNPEPPLEPSHPSNTEAEDAGTKLSQPVVSEISV